MITLQIAEVRAAEVTLTELRHRVQSLEVDRDSRNLKASWENSLREVEKHYAMHKLSGILLRLESELVQTQA